MWRLIKAELGYLRYFIYGVSLLILVHGFAEPVSLYEFQNGHLYITRSPIESLREGIQYLLPFHVIVAFILLYLYLREARLRQYVSMPVRMGQILLARLATPIILTAIFIFMSLVPVLIYGVFFSKDLIAYFHNALQQYSDLDALSNHLGYYGQYGQYLTTLYYEFEQPLAITAYTVQLMLFLTYAFWLFSERFGWYLLGAYFAFVAYHDGILPLYNTQLAWAISDFIHNSVSLTLENMHIHIGMHLLYASIVFIVLIAISFYTRRSFMR